MIGGFEHRIVEAAGVRVGLWVGGRGRPLLLLHGYPQTAACWARVAPALAEGATVVAADLPGYGTSGIPDPATDHAPHSKRRWAEVMVAAMAALGHGRFAVLGHDRGARVAYRMALDHPERVERVGILEVVPTAEMWRAFGADMAMKAYHWPFLAQPHPLPERLIGHDPAFYCDWTLRSWTRDGSLDAFPAEALTAYRAQMAEPARLRSLCEDYRAGATIDRAHDEADRAAARRIAAPLHFVHSTHGFPARTGDPLGLWRGWADRVTGATIETGHFAPEEAPEAVVGAYRGFFLGA
jgi:haloacetate dehalogenase